MSQFPKPNSHMNRTCDRIHQAGLCPSLCRSVGGCFMETANLIYGWNYAEAKRRVYRARRAEDALVLYRERR